MPHSLRVRLKNLQRKGELTEKDIDRIFKALSQEPCDDAISRAEVKRIVDFYKEQYDGIYHINESIDNLPSVTQKSGKWIERQNIERTDLETAVNLRWIYECSECGYEVRQKYHYCSNCGAKMEMETETWNGMHGQITAPNGTFIKIWNDCNEQGEKDD